MSHWQWFELEIVLAIHAEQIKEHGGLGGIRDLGLLQSALAKPQQLANYGDPDAADLAAAYGYGLAKNHPFADGNKRTAFVLAESFLSLHGQDLVATDEACYLAMLGLAAGERTQESFAQWLRANSVAR